MFEAFRVMNGGTMKTEDYTPIDKAKAEELLTTATELQAAFWGALSDLEAALNGIEIDGSRDLSGMTIEELMDGVEQDGDGTDGTEVEPS
jgi:hypothetical protein